MITSILRTFLSSTRLCSSFRTVESIMWLEVGVSACFRTLTTSFACVRSILTRPDPFIASETHEEQSRS